MAERVTVEPSRNSDHAYDRFLSSDTETTVQSMREYQQRLEKSNVKFGRFTIPSFFKPHFITPKQARLLHSISDAIVQMLDRTVNLYFHEPMTKNMFQLSTEAEELIQIDPGYSKTAVIVRLDCFIDGNNIRFMELNCDSPAGMGYADGLQETLLDSRQMDEFLKNYHAQAEPRSQKLLQGLLSCYEDFGGYEVPQIAIVDWKTVRTKPEFELLKKIFEDKGYKTIIADPREIKYKSGKLYHGNFRIDLIYRRVIFSELLEKARDVKDFIRGYRERAVCMVNPLRSRLAASKALLSIFTNPNYDCFFSAKENEIKREHIPWTRRVVDAEKFYGRKKIYLVDFLKDEKESLVLKPSDSYGGKDVTIGRETRDEDWNFTIDRALKENWVVQEFMEAPFLSVPTEVNGKLEFVSKKMNSGCFVFGGTYAGSLSRVSDETVINVSRGGGLVPTIVCEGEINR